MTREEFFNIWGIKITDDMLLQELIEELEMIWDNLDDEEKFHFMFGALLAK